MVEKKKGLTSEEARERLEKYGANKLKERKGISWLRILLDQFRSPLIYVLVFAAGVTLALGDLTDSLVIGIAVIVNTILGFYQEMKAERSLEALARMLTPKAKVLRDGKPDLIEATQVVPGDVCILELGERVPADGRLLSSEHLSFNEAILTGESHSVKKGKGSEVFMATTVSGGIGRMLVEKTGQKTKVGRIAESLRETKEEKTPLQKQIAKFSQKLAVMVGIVSLIILLVGLAVGDPFVEIFTTAVAVAVSAIPEGLAVSLTVILAIGMQRIFKRRSLVRKLVAAETLGSVTVICADKTGTLTEGKMRVVEVLESIHPSKKVREMKSNLLTKAAILCNDMRDPLEVAMMDWAVAKLKAENSRQKFDIQDIINEYPRLDEIPFDPKWRYIATLHRLAAENSKSKTEQLLLVSGAPEEVLARCKTTAERRRLWQKHFVAEGEKGRRLVGFAFRWVNVRTRRHQKKISDEKVKNLHWLGCIVYEDPIREGVKSALKAAQQAGIKVKVITGDYRVTAEAVLRQLGLLEDETDVVMEGYQLEKLSTEELAARIDNLVLFARTNPEQKLRLVRALQERGEVVAMTGDGVNDAPALKKADIGIVVESASAVAKETADMVLLDSNFATIVAAVEEGRGIFVNLRKIILYLLSDAFSEVILVLGSIIFQLPLPLTAAQILWINLADDGLPDFALALEPKPRGLMKSKPRGRKGALLDSEIRVLIALISGVTGVLALAVFWFYWQRTGDLVLARTLAFTLLGMDSLLYVFSCKSLQEPLWREKLFDNYWLIGAVLLGAIFQVMGVYVPSFQRLLRTEALGLEEWLLVLMTSGLVIGMIEGVKWLFIKLRKNQE